MIIKQIRAVFLHDGPLASAFGKKGGGQNSGRQRVLYYSGSLRGHASRCLFGQLLENQARVLSIVFPTIFSLTKSQKLETIVNFHRNDNGIYIHGKRRLRFSRAELDNVREIKESVNAKIVSLIPLVPLELILNTRYGAPA